MNWRVLVVFLLAYIFTAKGHVEVSDTSYSVQTAEAIVTRGELSIAPRDGAFVSSDGRSYSKYGIGLALSLLPEIACAHAAARATHLAEPDLAGFFISFANVPWALALLWSFGRILRRFGVSEDRVTLLTIGLGLGSIAWRYAVFDFSEELQAALLLLAFDGATVPRTTPGGAVAAAARGGGAFAALVIVKAVSIIYLPMFGVYLLAQSEGPLIRRTARAAAFTAPVVAAIAFLAVLNVVRFHDPLQSGYGAEAHQFVLALLPYSLPRLLGSLDKGMLVFSPVLVLGLLGWRAFFRARRLEALLALAIVVTNFLVMGAWHSWEGGWSWGPRLLVPTLALWLVPAGFWLEEGRRASRFGVALALTAVSIVAELPGVLVKDNEIHRVEFDMVTPDERPQFASETEAAWMLTLHKLRGRDEVYVTNDFDVPTGRTLDLREYRTFQGFNLWPTRVGEQVHRPAIRWLAAVGLLGALGLLARVLVELWSRVSKEREATASGSEKQLV